MTYLNTIFVLAAAFLAIFWEAAFSGLRHFLGAQVDLLPALMVFASLCGEFSAVCLLALFGGLWFDSLSANPLGITVLPLLLVGLGIYATREVILRDEVFAQTVLGLAASMTVPVLSLALMLTAGRSPTLGWGTVWQLLVMTIGGAVATPIIFALFDWLRRALAHSPVKETSFRTDREIRRGR